jgi:hypothetical protein
MHSQVVLSLFPVEAGVISLSEGRERERERDFREREIHERTRLESKQAVQGACRRGSSDGGKGTSGFHDRFAAVFR